MTYQSLNPASGKLLKRFEELTDKEWLGYPDQQAGTHCGRLILISNLPSALSNRAANGAILDSIIGRPQK
jgi:hypothetical protein